MAGEVYNLAWMTVSGSPGTGTFTLDAPVTSYLSLDDAGVPDGEVVEYTAFDGTDREKGEGTYTASGTTLTRSSIFTSTNANAAVNFGSGVQVLIDPSRNALSSAKIYPPLTRPRDANFAWINQGGASVTVNNNGGIYLLAPANAGDSLRIRKMAISPPYIITAFFIPDMFPVDFQQLGLIWRQSSDGKLVTAFVQSGNNYPTDFVVSSQDWNSATSFSGNNASITISGIPTHVWLQIEDDNSNRIVRYSLDGYNFRQVLSEGRTTFMTGDEVGFYASTTTASISAGGTLLSWAET